MFVATRLCISCHINSDGGTRNRIHDIGTVLYERTMGQLTLRNHQSRESENYTTDSVHSFVRVGCVLVYVSIHGA